MLSRADLPEKYAWATDAILFKCAYRCAHREFDGRKHNDVLHHIAVDGVIDNEGNCLMTIGDILAEYDFQSILKRVRRAATLLSDVNDALQKENESWKGNEAFII
jgi:hypothetical protein